MKIIIMSIHYVSNLSELIKLYTKKLSKIHLVLNESMFHIVVILPFILKLDKTIH